jgi:hypothetical protein
MEDGGVVDHMNEFSMLVAQLGLVGDNIEDMDCCMLLLCYFLNLWDHVVMDI